MPGEGPTVCMRRRGADVGPGLCACGRVRVNDRHRACTGCIERHAAACPVLDSNAVRYVEGFPPVEEAVNDD